MRSHRMRYRERTRQLCVIRLTLIQRPHLLVVAAVRRPCYDEGYQNALVLLVTATTIVSDGHMPARNDKRAVSLWTR
jgi:hypothetical protein